MMLKKMLALCKKASNITVTYFGEHKFLSNNKMMAYIGEEAKEWTSKDCAIALELGENADEKCVMVDELTGHRPPINVSELKQVEELRYPLSMDGTVIQPFMLPDRRVFFVDTARLKVFENEHPKQYYFMVLDGNPQLVIARNTFPIGVIAPTNVNLDTMLHFAQELNTGVEVSSKTAFCDAGGQISIKDA